MSSREAPGSAQTVRDQINQMADKAVQMLRLVRDGFTRHDRMPLEPAAELGRHIHQLDRVLLSSLVGGGEKGADEPVFVPMHLERIGDNIEGLAKETRGLIDQGVLFTDRAVREVTGLFGLAIDLLECVRDALLTSNRTLVAHVLEEGALIESRADEHALSHQKRLVEGICVPQASSAFIAMLDHLKGVEWHAREVATRLSTAHLPEGIEDRRHRHA
jgi:Na+/phosphate symporter